MLASTEKTALRFIAPEAYFYLRRAKQTLLNVNSKMSKKQSVFGVFWRKGPPHKSSVNIIFNIQMAYSSKTGPPSKAGQGHLNILALSEIPYCNAKFEEFFKTIFNVQGSLSIQDHRVQYWHNWLQFCTASQFVEFKVVLTPWKSLFKILQIFHYDNLSAVRIVAWALYACGRKALDLLFADRTPIQGVYSIPVSFRV